MEILKNTVKKFFEIFGLQIIRTRHIPRDAMSSAQEFILHMSVSEQPVCFDVGANTGQTIDVFLKSFDSAKIYAFEPGSELFSELETKFSTNQNVILEKKGLSNTKARKEFFINRHSTLNSLHQINKDSEQAQGGVATSEIIELTTLDEYCDSKGIQSIDVLKIDVQGHEPEVLLGAQSLIESRKIRWIIAEIQFGDMYVTEGNDMLRVTQLLDRRYQTFAIVDATYIGKSGALSHADFVFKARQ